MALQLFGLMARAITLIETQFLNPNALILRGLLALAFGLALLLWPGLGLLSLALVYGAFAFADGVASLACGWRRGRRQGSWGLPVFQGLLGIAIGVLTLAWPAITLLALAWVIGVWALLLGGIQLFTATRMGSGTSRSRALFATAGVLAILLGIGILSVPVLGLLTLLTLISAFSLLSGGMLFWMGIHLKRQPRLTVSRIDDRPSRAA